LIGIFERDIVYLKQNLIPLTSSGVEIKALDYQPTEFEHLSDKDVQVLCEALVSNLKFRGPLNLSSHGLSNLSALYLSKVFAKQCGENNISELNLNWNQLTSKAGQFIGEALYSNPEYNVTKITFENTVLEEEGLMRMMEATSKNQNIKHLHVGIVSDAGLMIMAKELKNNLSLHVLEFQESAEKTWTIEPKKEFAKTLKDFT